MSVETASPEQLAQFKVHPRKLGWIGTTALAMGGSNQSLFLMGALFVGQGAISGQGSAAIPLLIVGLLLSWAAAPGWTELVLMWPNRVGGIAGACSEAFRPYNPVLSALTGCCYWWGWVPTCGLTAILSASAIQQWFIPGVRVEILATAIVAFFFAVNMCGIRWVVRLATPIAIISATLAFISALAPVLAGQVDWEKASTFHLTTPFQGWFGGLTSLMAGLYLIGFAAPAFEAATCHVGETIDPKKNVPRSMLASGLMAGLYFAILPVVWLGALGPESLGNDLAVVLGPTFAPVLGSAAKAAAIGFMMFNMFHGTLQPLAGAARTLSQLADDGLLPRILSRRSGTDAPWVATLLTAVMAIIFLWIGDPIWLVAAANFTYLIGICMPSIAVWLLRRDAPNMPRPYRAPRGTIIAGLVAAGVWLVSAMLGFEQFGISTVIVGLALAYTGAAAYGWRVFSDRRRAGLPGFRNNLHFKLTGAMLTVLILDAAGYLLAISSLPHNDSALISSLQDIFVVVAMLTITVGLVLPGMIAHSMTEVSDAAKRLVTGTLNDFMHAMEALGQGNLEEAHVDFSVVPVPIRSSDEIGEMAENFNTLQLEIMESARSLENARLGLAAARSALLTTNKSLALQIQERGHLVEELMQARDLAQAASAAKSSFLAKMSHEIRTPMNGVLTTAELLHHSDLEPQQRKLLTVIRSSGSTLLSLIDEILDLSKLEAGKLLLQQSDFNLLALVNEVTAAFASDIARKPVEFLVVLPKDREEIWINSDPLRLKQVLTNLLSNAAKFTHQGKISVELNIVDESADQLDLTIAVRDTGIGITTEFMPHLFEPFSQARENATQTYGGSGLGLSIVRQIADLLGGSIEAQSDLGRGTNFTFHALVTKALTHSQAAEPNDENFRAKVCGNILVAEDNPVNQMVISESLAKIGHEFTVVENGEAALTALQGGNFDLVLMDMRMPRLDGLETTRRIRCNERENGLGRRIPIIALSANAMAGDFQLCLNAGMDDHLSKPFTLVGLSSKLDRWLAKLDTTPPELGPSVRQGHNNEAPFGDGPASIDELALKRIAALQRAGRPNVLARIVETFISTTSFAIDQLEAAVGQVDFDSMRVIAHGLKSASANVGARSLSERCRELEALASDNNIVGTTPIIASIRTEFLAARRGLEAYLEDSRNFQARQSFTNG